jgi:hypothetical protein
MAYCLRALGVLETRGKRGNTIVHRRPEDKAAILNEPTALGFAGRGRPSHLCGRRLRLDAVFSAVSSRAVQRLPAR